MIPEICGPIGVRHRSRRSSKMAASIPPPEGKAMNKLRFLAILCAIGGSTSAIACEYPALVTIPTGNEATLDEMLEAQSGVRTYVAAMEAYLVCVEGELTATGDDAPEVFKSVMFSRHNAAMAEMEAIVDHFNEQIRIFRCTSGTESNSADQGSDANEECAQIPTG